MRYLIMLMAVTPAIATAQVSSTTSCEQTWRGGIQCQTRETPRIGSPPPVQVPAPRASGLDHDQIRNIGMTGAQSYSQGQAAALNDALLLRQLQIADLERERLDLELMRDPEYRQLLAERQRRQDRAYANELVSDCYEKRRRDKQLDCLAEALEEDPYFPAGFWTLVAELPPDQITQLIGDLSTRVSFSFPDLLE